MIVQVREWVAARTRRERRLLALMLAIALPVLAWLLVVRPLDAAHDAALERHQEAVDRNGRVRMLAAAAASAPAAAAATGGPELALVVTDSAAQAGLTLDSSDPLGPDAVAVGIARASASAAMQWLSALEGRGIAVEELRMVPGQDGSVSVNARLVRRRR